MYHLAKMILNCFRFLGGNGVVFLSPDSSFSDRLLHALSSPSDSSPSLLAELASSVSSSDGGLPLRERESEVLDKLGAEEEEILRYLIDLEETAEEEEEEGEDVAKKVGKEEGSKGKEGLKLRNHQHDQHRNKQSEEEAATAAMTTATVLETRHTTMPKSK